MKGQKEVVLDIVESGKSEVTEILNAMQIFYPNIKRSTVRGRLSELKKRNDIVKNEDGYRKLRN